MPKTNQRDLRIVNLIGDVNDDMLTALTATMHSARIAEQDIKLVLSTSGGDDQCAIAMFDLIKQFEGEVTGAVVGRCFSAGILIIAACDVRLCSENARFLMHFGSGEHDGAHDVKEMLYKDKLWNALVAEATGQPIKSVVKWHRKETYFGAKEAKAMNLVHQIVERVK